MADNYLERRMEEYERRKSEWLKKNHSAIRNKVHGKGSEQK